MVGPRHRVGEVVRVVVVAVQTVAAEQERVAGDHVEHQRVDLHVFLDADSARDDVRVRRRAGLLAGHLAALHHLGRVAVVFGELVDLPGAHHVEPAVADVRHQALAADDEHHHERRAHAGLAVVDGGHLVDLAARCVHGVLDDGDEPVAGVALVLAGLVDERGLLEQHALDRLDGVGGRHFACGVASHAVADHVEAERLIEEKGVLVVVAFLTDVGLACGDDVHDESSATTG